MTGDAGCIWFTGTGLCGKPTATLLCQEHALEAEATLAAEEAVRVMAPRAEISGLTVEPTKGEDMGFRVLALDENGDDVDVTDDDPTDPVAPI